MALPQAGLMMTAPRSAAGEDLACVQGAIEVIDCASLGGADLQTETATPAREWRLADAANDATIKAQSLAPSAPRSERAEHASFNIALVSDYRRAGVTKSANGPALQVGFDLALPGRWSAGARTSTIAEHGNAEVILYGAKSIEVGETELSLGASMLVYPRAARSDYAFVQASASRAIGPIDATLAVNYAPQQGNLDDRDNLYIVARARTPIGEVLGLPVTLGASVGRMRGRFAMAHVRSDWSLGLASRIRGVDVGLTYVDNDLHTSRGDPTVVLSLAHTF
jgi:uncharacterized protein (TIGR02001 family)